MSDLDLAFSVAVAIVVGGSYLMLAFSLSLLHLKLRGQRHHLNQ